jgi:hypothetical protein
MYQTVYRKIARGRFINMLTKTVYQNCFTASLPELFVAKYFFMAIMNCPRGRGLPQSCGKFTTIICQTLYILVREFISMQYE